MQNSINGNGVFILDHETTKTLIDLMPVTDSDNYLQESKHKSN